LVYSDESGRRIKMGNPGNVIRAAWLIFVIYWIVASFRVNQIREQEPRWRSLIRFAIAALVFLLLWNGGVRAGFLGRRFTPRLLWVANLGAAFTCAGIAFAIWSRYHIGQYWSRSVALKVGHALIRTGPYARIRHPIYTGILFALAGTAVAVGTYGALLAFVLLLTELTWKSMREEAPLAKEFGRHSTTIAAAPAFSFPAFPNPHRSPPLGEHLCICSAGVPPARFAFAVIEGVSRRSAIASKASPSLLCWL
jgi:protein-S-isoprenylcysteine O-methyltransferase Ste14